MFQVGGIGPMQGQAVHFTKYAPEKIPYAIKRYIEETKRLYTVLNNSLEGKEYLVGNSYSLADAISYPLVRYHSQSGISDIDDLPNLKTWIARIDERPATQRGLNVPTPDKIGKLANDPKKKDD